MGRSSTAMCVLAYVVCAARAGAEPPLQALARSTVGAGQGVYAVAGDGTVLVAQATEHAVHPASVTKIATSLALLERLGAAYRFATRIRAVGPLRAGRLAGDLLAEGGADPFLIDESGFLILKRLRARGLRVVEGRLLTTGPLFLDWQPDPGGRRLEAVLAGEAGAEAWGAVATVDVAKMRKGTLDPERLRDVALVFLHHGTASSAPTPAAGDVLAVYRSPPLLRMIKLLNDYSNNVFHFAADAIGGVAAVQEAARARVPEAMGNEIVIANGAGAGTDNRLSPRAAVALLDALAHELARNGHDLTAALPVSGIDPGTLEDRLTEYRGVVVGKTGTSGSVGASALVGALKTKRRGVVRFAVLNHGVAVAEARARQDAFTRALIEATEAEPWPYVAITQPVYLDAQAE